MSLKYVVIYKVTGFGEFPWDMLRYDRSSPYSAIRDSYWLNRSGEYRTIQLITHVESPSVVKKGSRPCRQRWDSFGWCVSEITVEKMR